MNSIAHNFGKPLGYAVVADCPEYPKQDGMLCGGAHTFEADAHKAARDPAMGSCRVVPLGPLVTAPPVEDLLVLAVECGVIRLSQVMDADLQDALTAFAKRLTS